MASAVGETQIVGVRYLAGCSAGQVHGHSAYADNPADRRSGKGGALLRRPPLGTARATRRGIRLEQAAGGGSGSLCCAPAAAGEMPALAGGVY